MSHITDAGLTNPSNSGMDTDHDAQMGAAPDNRPYSRKACPIAHTPTQSDWVRKPSEPDVHWNNGRHDSRQR